jgi:hypothetical protein
MFDAVKLMFLVVKKPPGNNVPYMDFRPAEQHVTIIGKNIDTGTYAKTDVLQKLRYI